MWLNNKIYNNIAAEGVCVVGPYSCPTNIWCDHGRTDYMEILKTLVYIEDHSDIVL